jgi:hypothetical protein
MGEEDLCPWLPPWFEPLEMLANGHRLDRQQFGANGHGRKTLARRIADALMREPSLSSPERAIIEVGSWAGSHALHLAGQLWSANRIYCVDTWAGTPVKNGPDSTTAIASAIGPDQVYRVFLKNVREKLFNPIIPCRGSSKFWASVWPHPVAAIFIDADHSYAGVKEDLAGWWPHVRPGGLFCGHDYHLFPGVKQAVDEWVKAQGLGLIVEEQCWFVTKPAAGEIPHWHAMPEPHDHVYGE